jgi:hypothetical protein
MRSRSLTALSVVLAGAAVVLTSCAGSSGTRPAPPRDRHYEVVKAGPPPHAPAHGYRHKHRGVVLVYEASLDVYRVEGRSGIYFYGSYFYRSSDGHWEASVNVGGPWRIVPDYRIPGKLLDHHYAKAGKKKHKHGHKHNRW